ncbi:hypothetical protein ALFP_2668 [Alcaligenes faecalis]|nr:hypothetical protein ALFP_2668 [Alcaligenes faecalis]
MFSPILINQGLDKSAQANWTQHAIGKLA